MYSRRVHKFVKHVKIIAATSDLNSTEIYSTTIGNVSGRILGESFDVFVRSLAGHNYIIPDTTTKPSTDFGIRMTTSDEGIYLKCRNRLTIYGEPASKIEVIVWDEEY